MQETPQQLTIPLNLIFELTPDWTLPDDFSCGFQMPLFDSIDRIVETLITGSRG